MMFSGFASAYSTLGLISRLPLPPRESISQGNWVAAMAPVPRRGDGVPRKKHPAEKGPEEDPPQPLHQAGEVVIGEAAVGVGRVQPLNLGLDQSGDHYIEACGQKGRGDQE